MDFFPNIMGNGHFIETRLQCNFSSKKPIILRHPIHSPKRCFRFDEHVLEIKPDLTRHIAFGA